MTATMPAMILAVTGLGSRIVSLSVKKIAESMTNVVAADDGELDELVVPLGVGPDRPRQARDRRIGEGHESAVYGNERSTRTRSQVTAGQRAVTDMTR